MPVDREKLEAQLERVVGDLPATCGGAMVSLGDTLGLYRAMAGAGPLTPAEVAARAGCAERYVRGWLNAQAAGGYVEHHPVGATCELTPEQEAVPADPDSPVFVAPAWDVPASFFIDEESMVTAFRTGDGVAWGDHHPRMHHGVARFYRNVHRASPVDEWIPALDGVADALAAGARVADVGCGHGHSAVTLAEAFPAASLAPGGTIMLVEPYAGDRVEVGRLCHAASTVLCTAHALSEHGPHALAARAGEARIAEVCRRAGLTHVRRAAETPFNLILEIRP